MGSVRMDKPNAGGGSEYEEQVLSGEIYIESGMSGEGTIDIPNGFAAAKYVVLQSDGIKGAYVSYDRSSNVVYFGGEASGYVGSSLAVQVTAVKTM